MDNRIGGLRFFGAWIVGLFILSLVLSCGGDRKPRGSAVLRVPAGTFVATSSQATILGASNRVTTIDATTGSPVLITQVGSKRADAGGGFIYYVDDAYASAPADAYALAPGTHRIAWYYVPPGEDGYDLIVNKKERPVFEFVVEVQ